MKTIPLILLLMLAGCINFKTTLPNGTEILYQRMFMETQAKKIDYYFEDPNTLIWIIANDPNSSVNPGRLIIKEPKTDIVVGLESK